MQEIAAVLAALDKVTKVPPYAEEVVFSKSCPFDAIRIRSVGLLKLTAVVENTIAPGTSLAFTVPSTSVTIEAAKLFKSMPSAPQK